MQDGSVASVLRAGRLTGSVEAWARDCLGSPIGGVEVRETAAAHSFTDGARVFLSSRLRERSDCEQRRALGHELAHVAQHHWGRVAPGFRSAKGVPFALDHDLETEAERCGHAFAHGARAPVRPGASWHRRPPIWQPRIEIGGEVITDADELSVEAQAVLTLIPDGWKWFESVGVASAVTYSYQTTGSLIEGVQIGLHDTHWVHLRELGIQVGVRKLLSLGGSLCNSILAVEQGDGEQREGSTAQMLRMNLSKQHGIWSNGDLAVARNFLEEVGLMKGGVPQAPLQIEFGLSAWLELTTALAEPLGSGWGDASFRKEAATFAARQAGDGIQFVDYLVFYAWIADRLRQQDASVTRPKRQTVAQQLVASLRQALLGRTQGIQFEHAHELTPIDVYFRVNRAVNSGHILGLRSISAGLRAMAREPSLPISGGLDDTVIQAVGDFVRAATQFVEGTEPSAPSLDQSGEVSLFPVVSKSSKATLRIGPQGILTLSQFDSKIQSAEASSPNEEEEQDD